MVKKQHFLATTATFSLCVAVACQRNPPTRSDKTQEDPQPRQSANRVSTQTPTSAELFKRSAALHDPQRKWGKINLSIMIVEPRVKNPGRRTRLELNQIDHTFKMTRARDEHRSTHIIDADGTNHVLLDGHPSTDPALNEKYRLDPKRNPRYQYFYEVLYGLPMSLSSAGTLSATPPVRVTFDNQPSWRVAYELTKPLFSKQWNIYFSDKDYRILGIDTVSTDSDARDYRLVFRDLVEIQGIKIPRFRHWHHPKDGSYGGTDVIVSTEPGTPAE